MCILHKNFFGRCSSIFPKTFSKEVSKIRILSLEEKSSKWVSKMLEEHWKTWLVKEESNKLIVDSAELIHCIELHHGWVFFSSSKLCKFVFFKKS